MRPNTGGAALELVGVSKRFGDFVAVDDVSLQVPEGEFVTLLGPSGSGKTTTLNVIAGLVEPSEGDVLLDGHSIVATPTHKRNIGMVFQHYALFPHMTVFSNVAFPLKQRRLSGADIAARVRETLEAVELEDLAERHPSQLSGGQQQRVALARALVFRPRVLLMDEPLGALDKKLRNQLQLEIKRIHRNVGITFVYVTHDQEEALVLSDRIAVFNRGRIEQADTGPALYKRPATLFVAQFIGDSNVFRGPVETRGDVPALMVNGKPLKIPRDRVPHLSYAAAVVRPECVHVARAGEETSGHDANQVSGRVADVIDLGASRHIQVTLDNGGEILVKEHTREPVVARGEFVRLSWKVEDTVVVADAPTEGGGE